MATRQWLLVVLAGVLATYLLSSTIWFKTYEYVAIWLEGIALVAIFGLDFFERREQEKEKEKQRKETLEQLRLSREQVAATLLSARAIINVERPLLVVTWSSDKHTPGVFRFGCRNQGRTAAKVISVSASIRFVKAPEELEVPPDYSTPSIAPDLNIIVGEDSFPIGAGLNPQTYIDAKGKGPLIANSGEFLVYFGNVVYRDTLYPDSAPEGLHETRWCFIYQPHADRKFVRGGSQEYQRIT